MEATINNAKKQYKRICPVCDKEFVANSAKRQFCSDNCRSANHRQKLSSTIKEQEWAVQHQAAELSELKAAPVSRTESIQVINVNWQLAKQAYETQGAICDDLKRQSATLRDDANQLTNPTQGAYLGAVAGIVCVLMCMARRYDDRKEKPLDMSFLVVSLAGLIAMSIIGYWMGRGFHLYWQADDEQQTKRLEDVVGNQRQISERIKAETTKLDQLRIAVSQVPKFEKETVTTVDETRVVPTNA